MDTLSANQPASVGPTPPKTDIPLGHDGKPLVYEETPIIPEHHDPVDHDTAPVFTPPAPPQMPSRGSSPLSIVIAIIFLIILFAGGFAASGFIRQYIGSMTDKTATPKGSTPTPTSFPVGPATATTSADGKTVIPTPVSDANSPVSTWKGYQVLGSGSRQPISGISFRLPGNVLPMLCDTSNCISQGTYLPGGTRFTVAPRGNGQALGDYRNRIISELGGKEFATKDTTFKGRSALDFSGTFTGTTVGGYAFSRMHGIMVPLTATTSLEINHFTPAGLTTDFDADETVFAKILDTFDLGSSPGLEKGSAAATPTATPTAAK